VREIHQEQDHVRYHASREIDHSAPLWPACCPPKDESLSLCHGSYSISSMWYLLEELSECLSHLSCRRLRSM